MSQYVKILERALKMISRWNKILTKKIVLKTFVFLLCFVFGKAVKVFL